MKAVIALIGRVLCAIAIVSTIGVSAATNSSASLPNAHSTDGTVQFARSSPGVGI